MGIEFVAAKDQAGQKSDSDDGGEHYLIIIAFMKLSRVLEGVVEFRGSDRLAKGVAADSREIKPGFILVAYKGVGADGHDFIHLAIAEGVVAVVGERDLKLPVPYFKVKNGRIAWAKMVANWYGNPEKKLRFIGVTGTDGKTTTSSLIYAFLKAAGKKAALVSTIKAVIGGEEFETGLHTSSPDPDVLWPWLSKMVEAGEEYAVLETTSHGLAQYRFGDIKFGVGVLTNLAHDHLEFHKTLEAYRDAKAMLFENSRVSVLNKCSKEYEYFKSKAGGEVIGYDRTDEIRKVAYIERNGGVYQEFEMKMGRVFGKIRTRLLGDYNLENILAASRAAKTMGVGDREIIETVEKFVPLPGRFQLVANNRGIRAVVDFAHTEQGLRAVLAMVKKYLRKDDERIIAVFGCNGERDQTKRAPMGRAAIELADLVIVTTEDPRMEPVDQIYRQIEEGCLAAGGVFEKTYFWENDRKKAIDAAINKLARPGDWVLCLGKGHEKSMNIGGVETPWDEVEIVNQALNK